MSSHESVTDPGGPASPLFMPNSLPCRPSADPLPTIEHPQNEMQNLNTVDSKKLITIMNHLKELGIENHDIDLPKAVVVGDQSAGKSSLVEGLSGIKVPRDKDTCTRCPLHIVTAPSDATDAPWTCSIDLLMQFKYTPESTRASNYGPWKKLDPPITKQFATTDNPEQLENLLRRAQSAILHPGKDHQTFLTVANTDEVPGAVGFSPNVVKLEIKGPDLPNLSFFDLPGVVSQTEDNSQPWLVRVVEQLTKDYIQGDKTLVILACSLENDLNNSKAAGIVRKYHADTCCIGVMTKPDRRPYGQGVSLLTSILSGEKFSLGYGYFVSKHPAQHDLNLVTHGDARKAEDTFFASAPWSTELADFAGLFGTANLQRELSREFTDLIRGNIPNIVEQVQIKLLSTEEELQTCPSIPDNAAYKVENTLHKFFLAIQESFDGTPANRQLPNEMKRLSRALRESLIKLCPSLILPIRSGEVVDLMDDEDIPTPARRPAAASQPRRKDTSKAKRPAPASDNETPTKRQRVDSSSLTVPAGHRWQLEDFKKALDDLSRSNVPGEHDPQAIDYLRVQSLHVWQGPVVTYLTAVHKVVEQHSSTVLAAVCEAHKSTSFYKEAQQLLKTHLQRFMAAEKDFAERLLRNEQHQAFTLNASAMEAAETSALTAMSGGLDLSTADDDDDSTPTPTPVKKGKTSVKPRKQDISDPNRREIEAMAKIQAYYQVATGRFVDSLVQDLQAGLIGDCRRKLADGIHHGLVHGYPTEEQTIEERCSMLLAPHPSQVLKRMQLKRQQHNLLEAKEHLNLLKGIDEMEPMDTA